MSRQNIIQLLGSQTTVTSGGSLALTSVSPNLQIFTGTSAHTVTLPSANSVLSLEANRSFRVRNLSTGLVTVRDGGANILLSMQANSNAIFTLVDPTSFGTWDIEYKHTGSATTTISASTTAPTKGSTSQDFIAWNVINKQMFINCNFSQISAGTNGSGTYRIAIPSGYSALSTRYTFNASPISAAVSVIGTGQVFTSGAQYLAHITLASATLMSLKVILSTTGIATAWGSGTAGLANTPLTVAFSAALTIA